MYIYRPMFHTVGIAHILYCWKTHCRSAQNMVVVVMMLTMMSNRRRRGYLRTVISESIYETPHMLLYSSISVHCHTVNSLFGLPHNMLTVLCRNLPACHFIGQEEQ